MLIFWCVLGVLIWWAIGTVSLIYWWTNDFDMNWVDLLQYIGGGLILGVGAFIFFALPILISKKIRNPIMRKRNG